MDSLFDVLATKDFEEPPEIKRIKDYVKQQYNQVVGVQLRDRDILIIVSSAALASTLRLNGPKIIRQCELNKKLTFRIS